MNSTISDILHILMSEPELRDQLLSESDDTEDDLLEFTYSACQSSSGEESDCDVSLLWKPFISESAVNAAKRADSISHDQIKSSKWLLLSCQMSIWFT